MFARHFPRFVPLVAMIAGMAAPSWAQSGVKIASVAPEYRPMAAAEMPERVSMQSYSFEVEPATGRARVVIDYTYPDQAAFGMDGGAGPEPTMAQLPGLKYDTSAKTVIYETGGKRTVCATVRDRKSLFRIIFLAVPLCTRVCAQQPLALSLSEAEKLAIQNNPKLGAARLNASAAYQVPIEIHAGLLPSVNGTVTGVGADSGSRLAAGGLNNPVVYSRLASGLMVNQLVTDFGRTGSLIASEKLRAQAQDQVTETTRAYFAVLRANTVLRVAQQTVSARQLVSDQITALFNSQLKSQLDVSFANVNLADAQLLLSQAQNDLKSAEADLAAAIGLPIPLSAPLQLRSPLKIWLG